MKERIKKWFCIVQKEKWFYSSTNISAWVRRETLTCQYLKTVEYEYWQILSWSNFTCSASTQSHFPSERGLGVILAEKLNLASVKIFTLIYNFLMGLEFFFQYFFEHFQPGGCQILIWTANLNIAWSEMPGHITTRAWASFLEQVSIFFPMKKIRQLLKNI